MSSSQCVPSCEVEDTPNSSHHHLLPSSSVQALPPMLDYNKVAELTWQNGQVSDHGLVKPTTKYPTFALGTLESIVDQVKLLHPADMSHHYLSASNDALVPTHYRHRHRHRQHREIELMGIGSSCNADMAKRKKARVEEGPIGIDGGGSPNSIGVLLVDNNNETTYCGTDDLVSGSPDDTENTSIGGRHRGSRALSLVDDEHDSLCYSRGSLSQRYVEGEDDEKVTKEGTVRSTVSTKRSRAVSIHNQSERKRRDKINQRMRTLQNLVPNSDKTDKASVLDEVIGYMKQLQAQVRMMKSMSSTIPPMMMPIGMQQYQMAQMAQMVQMVQMGMGMGMMDMASLGWPGPAGISPVLPTSPAFLPVVGGSWNHYIEQMQALNRGVTGMSDPFSTFGACPTQQAMSMDAHQRMAALYQQQMFQQSKSSTSK